jgi:cytochrome c biogenesis protein ResB
LLFALQYFVRLQKLLTAFKAICSIKSLINDKKAERLAKRRERRRQRLLKETAEEREARLGKRRKAWKKKTAEAKGKQRSCLYNAMYQLYCSYTS